LLELDGVDYRAKPLADERKAFQAPAACKRIDLPYRPGPSKSWITVKNKKHPAILRVKEAFELERQGAMRAPD